ncbi:hypothetical protein KPJ18_09330, partial [Escherichia coli]|nr:hypothetical protein [Escherichia coli]
GTTCEITDKKGKGLPESGKGEALEIPHSPEKEPVSCLTDWHYGTLPAFFFGPCGVFLLMVALIINVTC